MRDNARGDLLFGAFATCALLLSGCAESTHPVSGVVTYAGKPVPKGTVVFSSEEHGNAAATIGADGRYQISLQEGRYGVGITSRDELPPDHTEGDSPPPLKEYVPFRFTSPRNSGLTADVRAGEENAIDFHLK